MDSLKTINNALLLNYYIKNDTPIFQIMPFLDKSEDSLTTKVNFTIRSQYENVFQILSIDELQNLSKFIDQLKIAIDKRIIELI